MKKAIRMDNTDTVATLLEDADVGDTVCVRETDRPATVELTAGQRIPFGNKIALTDIPAGTCVIKYGASIGESTRNIARGELVHVHNVRSLKVEIPPAFKREIMRQMGYGEEADV